MSASKGLAVVLLVCLTLAMIFGLCGLSMSQPGDMHCAVNHGITACAVAFEHADHWRGALLAIAYQMIVAFCVATALSRLLLPALPIPLSHERHRHKPDRPILFEEILACGILNCKIP